MRRTILSVVVWLGLAMCITLPAVVVAGEGSGVVDAAKLTNPLKFKTITDFFKAIIDIVLIFAVPIIVFFIMYAGFLYVTAQGSEEKISRATRAFTWAVVGGVLVLGAWALLTIIQNTVNALK